MKTKMLGSYSFFVPRAYDYSSSVLFNSNPEQKFLLRDQLVLRTLWPFTLWDLWAQGRHILLYSRCHPQHDDTFLPSAVRSPLVFSHYGPFPCTHRVDFVTIALGSYPVTSLLGGKSQLLLLHTVNWPFRTPAHLPIEWKQAGEPPVNQALIWHTDGV